MIRKHEKKMLIKKEIGEKDKDRKKDRKNVPKLESVSCFGKLCYLLFVPNKQFA